MKLRHRYQRLTFWNKTGFWGAVASIFGLVLSLGFGVIGLTQKMADSEPKVWPRILQPIDHRPIDSNLELLVGNLAESRIVEKSSHLEYQSSGSQDQGIDDEYNIENIFDGEDETKWTTDSFGRHFVTIDLGNICVLYEASFVNSATGFRFEKDGNNSTKVIEVCVSQTLNPNDWVSLGTATLKGYGHKAFFDNSQKVDSETLYKFSRPQRFMLPPTACRYVRFVFREAYWNKETIKKFPKLKNSLGYSMAEIRVWGKGTISEK